jgi:hypothetical protein
LAVSGINFVGPVNSFSSSGSGTFQSAVGSDTTMVYFADDTNTQGANSPTDLPGTLLATDFASATLLTDSFAFNHNGAFVATGLHGMSLGTEFNLTAGGTIVGRNQAIVTEAVAEPGSLVMLMSSLLGAGFIFYVTSGRRRKTIGGGEVAA